MCIRMCTNTHTHTFNKRTRARTRSHTHTYAHTHSECGGKTRAPASYSVSKIESMLLPSRCDDSHEDSIFNLHLLLLLLLLLLNRIAARWLWTIQDTTTSLQRPPCYPLTRFVTLPCDGIVSHLFLCHLLFPKLDLMTFRIIPGG